jgi:hypothetical protein
MAVRQPMMTLILRPHRESGGYHLDRFDAYLGDQLICTSRSGWHTPARELLRRGYSPDTLLYVQHHGKSHDPPIVPKSIGDLAKWYISEEDAGGLRRRRWQPKPDDVLATMYPDMWTEPSGWPWDAPPSTGYGSPAGAEHQAAA